ncbi:MAG: phosphatase PAP2 family protein [Rhodocyclaceae bacterium]|nr:phosphatase PAP2 family protein [Rhodocyclaceae bacterium]
MERMTSSWHRINALDLALCLRCNRVSRYALLCHLFRVISRLGNGVFWYSLMSVMLLVDGMDGLSTALRMTLAGLACLAIYKYLKTRTSRPRPYQVYTAIAAAAPALDRFSFPSGHTLHAVCFTTVACNAYPQLAPVLWPFTALVAVSRPILGLHYPSDVLAGALIGLGVAQIAIAF